MYHVTARGNERKKIFSSSRDYEKFLQYISDAREKFRFLLHAYVLMGNHYHLIIETPEGKLSRAMHYINSSYTTYTNIKRQRCGHLFQGRFKAIVIDKESYLLELSCYVHLNPVRAKMVATPQAYRYSSYRAYIQGAADDLIHTGTILGMLSGKAKEARERYRQFVEVGVGDEPGNPLDKVYGGMILGNERFIRGILQLLKDKEVEGEEISNRKDLRRGLDHQAVLTAVSAYFRVNRDDVLADRRSLARRAFVYVLKRYGAIGNREICELVGCASVSAATKICLAFERELKVNPALRAGIKVLVEQFSTFKGRPL
jgi:REP element-mobilizing transposase RayT